MQQTQNFIKLIYPLYFGTTLFYSLLHEVQHLKVSETIYDLLSTCHVWVRLNLGSTLWYMHDSFAMYVHRKASLWIFQGELDSSSELAVGAERAAHYTNAQGPAGREIRRLISLMLQLEHDTGRCQRQRQRQPRKLSFSCIKQENKRTCTFQNSNFRSDALSFSFFAWLNDQLVCHWEKLRKLRLLGRRLKIKCIFSFWLSSDRMLSNGRMSRYRGPWSCWRSPLSLLPTLWLFARCTARTHLLPGEVLKRTNKRLCFTTIIL